MMAAFHVYLYTLHMRLENRGHYYIGSELNDFVNLVKISFFFSVGFLGVESFPKAVFLAQVPKSKIFVNKDFHRGPAKWTDAIMVAAFSNI